MLGLLFYGQGGINTYHRAQNFIAECFREQGLIKKSITNDTLSQKYSADVGKICSTDIEKSDVPNFNVSNTFECGRNNPDLFYKRAYIATEGNEYFTDILHHLKEYQDRYGQRLSSKNLKEAVLRVMKQQEEEIERYINNITYDNSFQSPVTKNE